MPKFASNTDVPAERSRAEIDGTLRRYGATGFMYGWEGAQAMVAFKMNNLQIRFLLPMPDPNDREFTHRMANQHDTIGTPRDPAAAAKAWEQATRQRWRALALVVKAKLEAVESQITTFEEEFLAHIVTDDGLTIGQRMAEPLRVLQSGQGKLLLPDLSGKGGRS